MDDQPGCFGVVLRPWQHHAKVVISHTNLISTMSIIRSLMIFVNLLIASSISFARAVELSEDPVHVKMGKKFYIEQCAIYHVVSFEEQ